MAAKQIRLERLERIGRNLHFGEGSEARVDSVGRLVSVRRAIDDAARGLNAIDGVWSERDRLVFVNDLEQLIDCERRTVQENHRES